MGAACGPTGHGPAPTLATATGVVIAVDGPSSAEVDTFTLRTTDGQTLDFTVGRLDLSNGGLPAPHLREHLVSGIPITVTYDDQANDNVVQRYVDAEP